MVGELAGTKPESDARNLYAFGLGYVATRLARRLSPAGWAITGTARDSRAPSTTPAGVRTVPFHDRPAISEPAYILLSAPPEADGDPVLRRHGSALREAARRIAWIGYLSTTGVYGDADGAWVDEESPAGATEARSIRRIEAERAWLDFGAQHGLPVHIFRLPGIYGPGRSAIDDVRSGRARRIHKPGQVFCRIHVDDIVATLRGSMARPDPGRIYNVCDDLPCPAHEVVAEACRLLGAPVPPLVPIERAELNPMARSFYAASRRVRNDRIKRELGVRLAYPTYREGLAAILAET